MSARKQTQSTAARWFTDVMQGLEEEKVSALTPEQTYEDEAIQKKLADLPHWAYTDGALERSFKTANFKATLIVVTTVGHLCEAAWHHPDMMVAYNKVTIRLSTHSAKGITDKDFTLARKIEEVIAWQPGKEGGGLDGTPSDAKYAYIKYD